MINHLKFLTAGAALIAAVLSGPAQPIQSRQAKFSALTIVINFQQLSLAYETLTASTTLPILLFQRLINAYF